MTRSVRSSHTSSDSPVVLEVDDRRRITLSGLGSPDDRFYLASIDPNGTITLTPADFVPRVARTGSEVPPDSGAQRTATPSRQTPSRRRRRVQFNRSLHNIADGTEVSYRGARAVVRSGQMRLDTGEVFDSPSSAGGHVSGTSVNGWKEWKSGDGRSLAELHDT